MHSKAHAMNMHDTTRTFRDFLSFLEKEGQMSAEAITRAMNAYNSTDHPADTVLIELGLTKEADLAVYLNKFLGLPEQVAIPDDIDPNMLERAGFDYLENSEILPLGMDIDDLLLATADPFDTEAAETLAYAFDRQVSLRVFPRSLIKETLVKLRGLNKEPANSLEAPDFGNDGDNEDINRLKDYAREAPIIKFVSKIIQQAVDQGATDLHIEPMLDHVRIRFRKDGMLSLADTAPREMHAGISTRIKIMSRLNIAERRLPQDGRMRIAVRGQEIDLRVSVLPSVHGETFVLRVLDRSGVELSLHALGYDGNTIEKLKSLVNVPNGIVLVTGPTGSGKTTTLYSLLKERNADEVKIFTVEDPVEYRLEGITQLQVEPAIDLTFSRALRSVLRQDPDVILIGEIRDKESAQIAIQASLTGHLVLSTLHTNSAAGALTRLRDMGVDSFLIGASIRAVVAQRLLRKTCTKCDVAVSQPVISNNPGCPKCRGTGYAGRTVSYEILEISPSLGTMIARGADEEELNEFARSHGMISMLEQAKGLSQKGITNDAEIDRKSVV